MNRYSRAVTPSTTRRVCGQPGTPPLGSAITPRTAHSHPPIASALSTGSGERDTLADLPSRYLSTASTGAKTKMTLNYRMTSTQQWDPFLCITGMTGSSTAQHPSREIL